MKVRHVRVGELLQLRRELLHIDPAATYAPIGVRSFANGLIRYPSCTGAELSKMRYFKLPPHSLVVSNIKAWEGAVALTSGDDNERVVSNRFLTYTPRPKDVCLRYIWHYFASDLGTRQLAQASPGSADRNRTLGINAFEDLVIPLPELHEQRAVSARLDELSSSVSRLRTVDDGRNQLPKSLRERMIYGDLSDTKADLRKLGEVLREVADLVNVDEGTTHPSVGVRNRGRGLFVGPLFTKETTKYATLRRIHAGQFIYSKLKAFEAAISFVSTDFDGFFTSHEFPTFASYEQRADPGYLRHVFMTQQFTKMLAGASKGVGARRERLAPVDFLSIPVPAPSLPSQGRIAARLDRLQRVHELGERQQEFATALPQAARNEVFSKLL